CLERHPETVPTPGIELRMAAGAQVDVRVSPDQPNQEPDLLLPPIVSAPFASNPVGRHVVAQPLAGPSDVSDGPGEQAHFLVKFTVHRLFGRFAALDPALRELPRVFANPLAPEDLVPRVDQDDPDVGAIAVSIQHGRTPRSLTIAVDYIDRSSRAARF